MTGSVGALPSDDPRPLAGSEYLTREEDEALARAGYATRETDAARRPVLLVIDVTRGFCGDGPGAGLLDAVERYPHACGPAAWEAVPGIRRLVNTARSASIPMLFTRPSSLDSRPQSTGRWEEKNRRFRTAPPDAAQLVSDIGYHDGDLLLRKEAPSAFFGTPLARWLFNWGADGVVLCGGTTSGCVRATAVDAFSYNLKVEVASDATFDRIHASHRVSLLDLDLKYAQVCSVDDITRRWATLSTAGDRAARTRSEMNREHA